MLTDTHSDNTLELIAFLIFCTVFIHPYSFGFIAKKTRNNTIDLFILYIYIYTYIYIYR